MSRLIIRNKVGCEKVSPSIDFFCIMNLMTGEDLMTKINKAVSTCKKCRLYRDATNPVPGHGSTKAEIVFIGEAPGYYEDQQGIPFVGRAGKLLDQLLNSIRLEREDVWIGNIIKHRPPENRDPMIDEIRACSPYLEEQLRVIKPKIIITLGRYALNHFVKDAKISDDHGVPLLCGGRIIFPLYHPAAALRNLNVARILKEDFRKVPKVISGEIKPKDMNGAGGKVKDEEQLGLI